MITKEVSVKICILERILERVPGRSGGELSASNHKRFY